MKVWVPVSPTGHYQWHMVSGGVIRAQYNVIKASRGKYIIWEHALTDGWRIAEFTEGEGK